MLKKVFVSLILVASFLRAYSQIREININAPLFKTNKISQYTIYETIMLGDSVIQKKYKSSVIILNPDGTIREEQDFDNQGNIDNFTSKYEYQNGKLVREITDWLEQEEHDITEYEYENNRLFKQKQIESGILLGWHAYQCDKKGKIIGATYYNADGKPDTLIRYEYQNGRLTKFTRLNENGQPISSTQKNYNKQGLLIQETTQEGLDEETTTLVTLYDYNNQGKLVKQLQQSLSNKPLFEVNFFYQKNGLIQKVTSYDHLTSLFTIEEYEYQTHKP